jgi:hypothetical protein
MTEEKTVNSNQEGLSDKSESSQKEKHQVMSKNINDNKVNTKKIEPNRNEKSDLNDMPKVEVHSDVSLSKEKKDNQEISDGENNSTTIGKKKLLDKTYKENQLQKQPIKEEGYPIEKPKQLTTSKYSNPEANKVEQMKPPSKNAHRDVSKPQSKQDTSVQTTTTTGRKEGVKSVKSESVTEEQSKPKPVINEPEPVQNTIDSQTESSLDKSEATPPLPPKPVWKELEPEDRTDAVEHEIYELKKLNNKWNIMAASVRGKLHAHKGIWRDDAYAYGLVEDWTIIAVSDGAGSAKFSRIGAKIVCDESVKALVEMLSGYKLNVNGNKESPSNADLKRLQSFLTLGACAARDGVIREAHRRQISEKDMYATMLLLIHTKWKNMDVVGALQVGDGVIGVYTKDGTCTVMGIADHGEFSSETVFLTSWKQLNDRPYDRRIIFTIKQDVQCIAVMCDGVADDFFPEDKRLIELFVGNPIKEIESKEGNPVQGVLNSVIKEPHGGEALKNWLRYEKRGSSDDRTLVLFYRE